MPYATAADMLLRYDARRVGQLVRDNGTQASAGELTSDTVLSELLADASGMIDSALLRGGKYQQSDLDALATAGGRDAKALVRLTCDLTYGLCVQRRGYTAAELASMAPAYEGALKALDKLSLGENVFNIPANVAAGRPKRVVLSYRRQLISSVRSYPDLRLNPGNPGDPQTFGE